MPEKILELLENGSLTELQITDRLGITTDELKACMEYLQKTGFIKSTFINPTGGGCSSNCKSYCSACNEVGCNTISPSAYTVWEIV